MKVSGPCNGMIHDCGYTVHITNTYLMNTMNEALTDIQADL